MPEEMSEATPVVIETVAVQLNVPKETKEVADFFGALAKMVKAKAPATDYIGLVGDLTKAVEGYDKLEGEVKSAHKADAIAYVTKQVAVLFE